MLWNASVIKGYTIAAKDGHIGTIIDFLFEDANWRIRWLVVDTGNWLPGRKVLLPPLFLGHIDPRREVSVELTRQQVKDSPDIDTDLPASRQSEATTYEHYGWTPYWGAAVMSPGYGYLGDAMAERHYLEPAPPEEENAYIPPDGGDPHLRSIQAVTGYHLHATDGEIGHVEDVLVENADWSIRYFVVDTRNWWPGKHVLISPRSVQEIDWKEKLVSINTDRRKVTDSPAMMRP